MRTWIPTTLLLILDVGMLASAVYLRSRDTYKTDVTEQIVAAYVIGGFALAQLLVCIFGAFGVHKNKWIRWAYIAHALATIGLFLLAELGWFR